MPYFFASFTGKIRIVLLGYVPFFHPIHFSTHSNLAWLHHSLKQLQAGSITISLLPNSSENFFSSFFISFDILTVSGHVDQSLPERCLTLDSSANALFPAAMASFSVSHSEVLIANLNNHHNFPWWRYVSASCHGSPYRGRYWSSKECKDFSDSWGHHNSLPLFPPCRSPPLSADSS